MDALRCSVSVLVTCGACFAVQWHMVTIVFVYSRWGTNEVLSYVDGQLVSAAEMSWLVSPTEVRVYSSLRTCLPFFNLLFGNWIGQ